MLEDKGYQLASHRQEDSANDAVQKLESKLQILMHEEQKPEQMIMDRFELDDA